MNEMQGVVSFLIRGPAVQPIYLGARQCAPIRVKVEMCILCHSCGEKQFLGVRSCLCHRREGIAGYQAHH